MSNLVQSQFHQLAAADPLSAELAGGQSAKPVKTKRRAKQADFDVAAASAQSAITTATAVVDGLRTSIVGAVNDKADRAGADIVQTILDAPTRTLNHVADTLVSAAAQGGQIDTEQFQQFLSGL